MGPRGRKRGSVWPMEGATPASDHSPITGRSPPFAMYFAMAAFWLVAANAICWCTSSDAKRAFAEETWYLHGSQGCYESTGRPEVGVAITLPRRVVLPCSTTLKHMRQGRAAAQTPIGWFV